MGAQKSYRKHNYDFQVIIIFLMHEQFHFLRRPGIVLSGRPFWPSCYHVKPEQHNILQLLNYEVIFLKHQNSNCIIQETSWSHGHIFGKDKIILIPFFTCGINIHNGSSVVTAARKGLFKAGWLQRHSYHICLSFINFLEVQQIILLILIFILLIIMCIYDFFLNHQITYLHLRNWLYN